METPMREGCLPRDEEDEEAAAVEHPSSRVLLQCPSTITIAQASMHIHTGSSEETLMQENSSTEACILPENSAAEATARACNSPENPHAIQELRSSHEKLTNEQIAISETHKHGELRPADGPHTSSLSGEQVSHTPISIDPASSTKLMTQELPSSSEKPLGEFSSILAEERSDNSSGKVWTLSEEPTSASRTTRACENKTVDEGRISDVDTGTLEEDQRQVGRATASLDTVAGIGASVREKEIEPSVATEFCASHATRLSDSASIGASQETVLESGLKPSQTAEFLQEDVLERVMEFSEVAASHDTCVSDGSGIETSHETVIEREIGLSEPAYFSTSHDMHLSDGADTHKTVLEREVADYGASQYSSDGVAVGASLRSKFDRELKVFEIAEMFSSLDAGVDVSQKAELERKTEVFEVAEVSASLSAGAGIWASEKTKPERGMEHIEDMINNDTSLNDGAVIGASQNLELEREMKIFAVTEMHASGVGASHDTEPEEEICASLDSTLSDGAGFGASQKMEPESNDTGGIHASLDTANGASQKIEPERENEDFKVAELRGRAGTYLSDSAGFGASQKTELEIEMDSIEVIESHASLDTNLSIDASRESECEREMELPEPKQNTQDVQADLKPLPEGVVPEQQQRRKRGRKPGKKVARKEEKDVGIGASHESELEKETEPFEGSPSKQNLHSVENDQKRVREGEQQPRRRGRKPGTKVAQKEEEDVCFVCFDGGKLILCDKRSCPKAYHIECTGRESEFFRKRGQWFCGWHVCSHCSRSATMHCYMCPNALCNTCMKETSFLCIRKSRGLCEVCYPIVHMIEHNETINAEEVQVDFNDKETYEGLFKEYWQDLKLKLFLTSADLDKACKAKEAGEVLGDGGGNDDAEEVMGEEDGGSTDSDDRPPTTRHSRLMKRKRLTRSPVAEDVSASEFEEDEDDDDDELESTPKRGRTRAPEFDGWASKELADLIQSMKEDPKKQLPLFGVKKLLWRYIDDNKLINPRRRGQIVCDERLQKLFGKKHVGRFEMMKLISLHVATSNKNTVTKVREFQSGDNDAVEFDDGDDNWLGKRKPRRKADDNKRSKPDPYEYAAVNVKNINLIYLKRSVLDELRNDPELEIKVVGAFVRIRVPGLVNKSDTCYRLVQVVGTKQIYDALDPEKVTDVILEISNLHKREEVTADLVSNQDLAEEECRRLRRSVRCGFIKAMTVGELEERARALREAKVKDWFEIELLRLSHLRDRASEKGHKRELRECVEKLQLLSSPEERERQLKAPFDIDADPHMDPNYESDDEELPADDSQGDIDGAQSMREKASSTRFFDKGNSTGGAEKLYSHWDSGSFLEAHVKPQDTQPKTSGWGQKDHGGKDNVKQSVEMQAQGWNSAHTLNDKSAFSGQGKASWGDGAGGRDQNAGWNHQGSFGRKDVRWASNVGGGTERSGGWRRDETLDVVGTDTGARFPYNQGEVSAGMVSGPVFSPIHTPGSTSGAPAMAGTSIMTMAVDSEKEKIWYYQDPTRTIQGPFTMEQLRKWEKTNLFPLDLRIWRATETQDASILLSDALSGRFSNSFSSQGPAQGPNVNSFSLGPTHRPHVNGFPLAPTHGPNLTSFSVGLAQGHNVSSFPQGSTQGVNANGFPLGPTQGPNVHSFPPRSAQVQGFPPGPTQGPNVHSFPPGPTQGPHVHGFPPGPTQSPYVNSFSPAPTQGPYVNSFPAAPTQGPNVNSFPHSSMQGPGFPHSITKGPNVPLGHTQGTHFNNSPLGRTQGPHANSFPMGPTQGPNVNNISQMGRVIANPGRDFRNASVPTSDWQETGRKPGQDQHFFGPASNKVEGSIWGSGRTAEHLASNDGRDGFNRGHLGHGPNFRGPDQYQGNEGRFTPKKDYPCKYFSRGLCKKGQACDFRHE